MRKMYECPNCGARSCEEVELNTYHCHLCDVDFDIEEMGFDEAAQPALALDAPQAAVENEFGIESAREVVADAIIKGFYRLPDTQ